MSVNDTRVRAALKLVRDQLAEAAAAPKCHGCGCLHLTVEALERTETGRTALAAALAQARRVFAPKKYDCLGCAVCYPAIAANAFVEALPSEGERLDLCPTETPEQRKGWPPLPGDYHVIRYRAPVAVCTLNSDELARDLARLAPEGTGIVGTLHTENLGIERLILNVLANPNIRRLILCGEDTRQAIGHLPGQSLESLLNSGVDEAGRIRGAGGKRPVLKNVTRAQVEVFLRQVELVSYIGETSPQVLSERARHAAAAAPGPLEGERIEVSIPVVTASEPRKLTLDPAGYFVVYPDRALGRLLLEHFTKAGVLDCVIEGPSPSAVYGAAIERGLLTRLDHAAYLGRELARAERSLVSGEPYTQDRAAGEIVSEPEESCECSSARATEEGYR
jgi:tetrahydromethanopterin S-methyltransferase subunit A